MRSVAQVEYANAYADPLPAEDTFDRLEDLFRRRRNEIVLAKTRRMQVRTFDNCCPDPEMQASDRRRLLLNQLTQAELRRREIEGEIINVARLIVAEADAEVTR